MDHLRYQKYKNKRLENIFKRINISINDLFKFVKKELTKSTLYDWYDWLINYIPETIINPKAELNTNI